MYDPLKRMGVHVPHIKDEARPGLSYNVVSCSVVRPVPEPILSWVRQEVLHDACHDAYFDGTWRLERACL